MKLEQYMKETLRTLPNLESDQLNIDHMIFGLNAEFDELYEAIDKINAGEELGDYFWYLSNYCNLIGFEAWRLVGFIKGSYFNFSGSNDSQYACKLQCTISKLTNMEKRVLAYKQETTVENKIPLIADVFRALNDCCTFYDVEPEIIMQRNIDKLRARYPEKFTTENALNRDLEKERKELEK